MTQLGSRRWFGYTMDDGTDLAVELDESTYESANLGMPAVAAGALCVSAKSSLPVKFRRVSCSRVLNDETLRADFYVGTRAALDTLLASGVLTVAGVAWNVSKAFGEVRKVVPPTDTAQLDGDVDNNMAVV